MFSLFSSFDYFWLIFPIRLEFFLFFIFFLLSFKSSSISHLLFKFSFFITSFFRTLSSSFKFGVIPALLTLVSFFSLINFFSVFPFNFAHTSQIRRVFFIGLSLWIRFNFFMISHNIKGFLAHLIPEGGPLVLSPALFLIELVRNTIRPLTLRVRLVANILAGHLLLILLSKVVFSNPLSFTLYLGLNSVEIFVALIQSYIFVTIVSLYYCDAS